ncbi:MAG: hypothetical protein ABIY39_05845 [Sphingomonas sp.]
MGLAFLPFVTEGIRAEPPAGSARTRTATSSEASAATPHRAARVIAAIRRKREKCQGATPYPGPNELRACNNEASRAADRVLRLSTQNDHLNDLLSDLFDPLMVILTPEDERHDALAAQVTISANYTDFAIARAAVLTEATPVREISRQPPRPLFGWLAAKPGDGDITTRSATRRWEAIRNADCAKYPVPRCASRLDEVMRRMIRSIRSSA